MAQQDDADYVYRLPRWAVAVLVGALWSVPALNIAAVVWLKPEGPWNREVTWGFVLLFGVILSCWFLSKIKIVIGSGGVRFPLSQSQLLWEDVTDYAVVRTLNIEWVRVTDRRGKVFRILLTSPGGREFRRRLLAGLDSKRIDHR